MRYIKKENGIICEAPATLLKDEILILGYNQEANETMLLADGYLKYAGTLPLGNLDILDGEIVETAIEATLQDYDDAMENKLYEARTARGYTVREPSAYLASSNARWAQDAQDWVAYVDEVMNYGLTVQTTYTKTGVIPSLEDFKALLPEIIWTYEEDV